MQVRAMSFRMTADWLEELDAVYQDIILPLLERHPGFSSLLVFFDADTSKVLEITLFESEDARIASERAGGVLDQKLEALARAVGASPETENYDLRLIS